MSATTSRPQDFARRSEQVTRLRRAEGDGERGAHRRALHRTGIRRQPRRHVGRDGRPAGRVQRRDHAGRIPESGRLRPVPKRASTTPSASASARGRARRRPAAPLERGGRDPDRGRPAQVFGGVAAVRRGIAEREHGRAHAGVREQPGRDEPVSTVVARSADDDDAIPVRIPGAELLDESGSRVFHEDRGRDARANRRGVGRAHRGRAQDRDQRAPRLLELRAAGPAIPRSPTGSPARAGPAPEDPPSSAPGLRDGRRHRKARASGTRRPPGACDRASSRARRASTRAPRERSRRALRPFAPRVRGRSSRRPPPARLPRRSAASASKTSRSRRTGRVG